MLFYSPAHSGKVQGKLRGLVSQNRRRFLKYGFDLDCTYITNRVRNPVHLGQAKFGICRRDALYFPLIRLRLVQVIAMSAPVFGRHSSYRNDIHVVSRCEAANSGSKKRPVGQIWVIEQPFEPAIRPASECEQTRIFPRIDRVFLTATLKLHIKS